MAYDVVVLGAGHNGLVAAALLAKAGRRVLVLERNDRIGGCIQSGEVTVPGVVHDLWSTNQNLFVASPAYADLQDDLTRHGLAFAHSDRPFASVFPDGTALRVSQGLDATLAEFRRHDPRDADGWLRLYERFGDFQKALLPLLGTPLPSLKAGAVLAKATATIGPKRLAELAQLLLGSTRELGESYLATPEAKALLAPWGMHLDFGPDVAGGAQFPLVEAFSNMENGMTVVEGGAQRLVDALAAVVAEHGGEVRTNAEATRILTQSDRAVGVVASGERIAADAVLAGLTPRVLYGRLLAEHPLAADVRAKADAYAYGPATMMVHLVLDGPLRWAAGADLAGFAYVHVGGYVDDLARTYTAATTGHIPADPLLVVGQTTAVDPTRAPAGTHVVWIQVRTLPPTIRGDAAGEIAATDWDAATPLVAERVLARLERYAPGVRGQIRGRRVYGPADLERHNPNLVGGDSVGGSHHLRQNFLFRPFPGYSTYETPVDGLYACGASTWPGAGNNGASGYLAANAILGRGARVFGGALAGAGLGALGALVAARRRS